MAGGGEEGRRYLINRYFPLHFCVRLKLFLKKKTHNKVFGGGRRRDTQSFAEGSTEARNWLGELRLCPVGLLCVPVPSETIREVSLNFPLQCVPSSSRPLHTVRCYVGATSQGEDLQPVHPTPSPMSRAVHQTWYLHWSRKPRAPYPEDPPVPSTTTSCYLCPHPQCSVSCFCILLTVPGLLRKRVY